LDFLENIIQHYQDIGINPKTKTVVFSDSLNVGKVIEIHSAVNGRVKDSYGIGTHLTNDVGVKPLNMVVKLVGCKVNEKSEWKNVIKLSDDQGKNTGDILTIQKALDELYGGQ
jgi:nicotinate phosphoribosyltransferase